MAQKRINRIITSSDRRNKLKRRKLIRIWIALIVALVLIVGLIVCLRLNYFRINEVNIEGVSGQRKDDIATYIEATLAGNKYLVVPKSQIYLYSPQILTDNLAQNFEFIQEVKATKKYPHVLNVIIKERAPVALYCDSSCYFIDPFGFIYAPASSFSPGVYLMYSDKTRSSTSTALHTFLTDTATYEVLGNYIKDIEGLGLMPVKVTFIAPREIQIDIRRNGYILLNLDRPYTETIENIKTVFLEGVTGFQYIDVRYGNKIFYKI